MAAACLHDDVLLDSEGCYAWRADCAYADVDTLVGTYEGSGGGEVAAKVSLNILYLFGTGGVPSFRTCAPCSLYIRQNVGRRAAYHLSNASQRRLEGGPLPPAVSMEFFQVIDVLAMRSCWRGATSSQNTVSSKKKKENVGNIPSEVLGFFMWCFLVGVFCFLVALLRDSLFLQDILQDPLW